MCQNKNLKKEHMIKQQNNFHLQPKYIYIKTVTRFILSPETTKKTDKIYETQFQDIRQATNNSNP